MKLAIVTGASSGIGLATTNLLSKNGYQTIMVSKSRQKLVGLDIKNTFKIPFDLSQIQDYQGLYDDIKSIESRLGSRTTVLVNAAGITGDKLLLSMKGEEIDTMLRTNLHSSILLSQFVIPGMLKQKQGSIVNISSVIGPVIGNTGQSIYGATKAGLVGFTKSLAREMGKRSIRVNAIAPGFIDTPMTFGMNETKKMEYLASIPLGRFGTPDEVAEAVMFLVNAPYVTGQCLTIDGGLTS